MSEITHKFPARLAAILSMACVIIAVAYGGALVLLDKFGHSTVERMGQRGDAFAFLNTIFSGIGMVFVALTLWTTHQDLADQRAVEKREARLRLISQLLEANAELQAARSEPGPMDFTSLSMALTKMRANLLRDLVEEAESVGITAADPIKQFLNKPGKK